MTYIPTGEVDYEQRDLQQQILAQLKIMNLHLHSLSGEEINEEDVE